jgi:hypothetical protein
MPSVQFSERPVTWRPDKSDENTGMSIVSGHDVSNVQLAEDGLPVDQNLRDAVERGIARVIRPPAWVDAS